MSAISYSENQSFP